MELLEVICNRRSIRKYETAPLAAAEERALREAIIWAPSAGNLQARVFYFVRDAKTKRALVAAAWGQEFLAEAPLVLVGCAALERIAPRYGRRGTTLYALQDVAASVQNLLLVAQALGLGTCWVGAFDEAQVSRTLNLPSGHRPVALVPVGKPAESHAPPPRLPQSELLIEHRPSRGD